MAASDEQDEPLPRRLRSRKERRSGDDVLGEHQRNATYGAGLNELDTILDELDDIKANTPTRPMTPDEKVQYETGGRGSRAKRGLEAVVTSGLVVVLSVAIALVYQRPAACDDTCEHAGDGSCDDGGPGSVGGGCAPGSDCADCGPRDFAVPHWLLLVGGIVCTQLLTVGVGTVASIARAGWSALPSGASCVVLPFRALYLTLSGRLPIPLTDATIGVGAINKLANSTQVREKGLKIVQYTLRGLAYAAIFSDGVSAQMKALSKVTSIARRCFKFLRWVKHFEDLAEAKEQRSTVMRGLLYFRIAANFGADWAEDVCSLERVGFLPKGTLSAEFMLFAEYCQLALALVEIFVTTVRARKESQIADVAESLSEATAAAAKKCLAQRRKLAIVRLELIKFVSDVGKALFDCELAIAHEGVFIGCSLFSALLSTHKNMFKIFK